MGETKRVSITLNHKPCEIDAGMTVSELLSFKGFPKSVAVFVNKTPLLMKTYPTYELKEADTVIVFRPLGGG
ncbi:sulfur carrier protein ThiS [Acidaminobacter sp.]|uniref:sulfur carrier protein ThiS n=1 Tax=Acidaminobacter sp. TaxID=1872102 RepID=UPI00256A5B51|nr:sulfur carrier protein ThiS [Acidaminobacter sp.]MDK9709901.1 sulfur carrier protein ThiS [Acidaminobacter sp.]